MQSELPEGVLHRGEDHAGADGAPEVGPAGGDHAERAVVWRYIREHGQLEVLEGLQEVLK